MEKMTPLTVKKCFFKIVKSFEMVQGSLNRNIIFLGEKLWPVAWKQKLVVYKFSLFIGKNWNISVKSVNMKWNFRKTKNAFLSHVLRITQSKN